MAVGIGDILRASVHFELADGTQYQNVWHFIKEGALSSSDAVITAAVQSHFNGVYGYLQLRTKSTVVPALCSLDMVEFVTDKWVVVANVGTFTLGFTGSSAGDAMPNQIAPYVLYKTARPKTVGRKFMFPMTETNFDGSYLDGTLQASLVQFAAASMVDVYISALEHLELTIPRTGVAADYRVQLAIVTNVTGTQRRRRPGVGA